MRHITVPLCVVALLFACNKSKSEPESSGQPADSPPPAPVETPPEPATPTPLAAGEQAPAFSLPAHDGSTVSLADLAGKIVVLYFYPKDDTPGCTIEAKAFRDDIGGFESANAVVLGVSLDDVDSHSAFAEKYELPFKLLADTDGAVAAKYGVDTSGGYARRVTFVIRPDGTIARTFPDVNPDGHSQEVREVVQSLVPEGGSETEPS